MPSIQELKAAFKKSDSQAFANNYYPFWEMDVGKQAKLRFLPDVNQDNPHGFLVEKLTHALIINGEKKVVPCLKMYNEECPICKLSSFYYKQNNKEIGKKFWRTKQHIAQILVLKDPIAANEETNETHEGKYRLLIINYQLYNIIKDAFEGGELEDLPYAYKNGYDFTIKKTTQGEYFNYTVGTKFAGKPSDLSEEEVATAMASLVDLSTLLPAHPGREKVEALLKAAHTGTSYVAETEEVSDATEVASTKPISVVPAKEEESGATGDADAILAKIRARRTTTAAAA